MSKSKTHFLPQTSVTELAKVLSDMAGHFNEVRIVIDALDECPPPRTDLLTTLSAICQNISTAKAIFTSRDEPDIRRELASWDSVSIAAQSSDLRLYVGEQIATRIRKGTLRFRDQTGELKAKILEKLVEGAEGM
jgi:hypothetical protein